MGVNVEMIGGVELQRAMSALDDSVQNKVMRAAMKKSMQPVLAAAKALVPVDTGRLKASLKLKAGMNRKRKYLFVRLQTGTKKELGILIADVARGLSEKVIATADDDEQFQTIGGAMDAPTATGQTQFALRLRNGTTGYVTIDNARTTSQYDAGDLEFPVEGHPGFGSMRRLGHVRVSFAG